MVHNNSGGEDAKTLKQFKEPAWNYQVIRFLDKRGNDIIPRKDKIWTMEKLVPRIEKTLITQKKTIPDTLNLLKLETETSKHRTIALAMHCFWTGEMRLGGFDGVVSTEAGWYNRREVTLVTYHTEHINLETLLKKAAQIKCANKVYLRTAKERELASAISKLNIASLNLADYRPAKKSDQKKQLSGTKYAKLKLTPSQATKVNSYARTSPDKANRFLTRKQAQQIVGN